MLSSQLVLLISCPPMEEVGNRVTCVPYHLVPHTYLGTINAFEEFELYVFFPHLYGKGHPSNYLTDDQSQIF